jgi:hypothetical protein
LQEIIDLFRPVTPFYLIGDNFEQACFSIRTIFKTGHSSLLNKTEFTRLSTA